MASMRADDEALQRRTQEQLRQEMQSIPEDEWRPTQVPRQREGEQIDSRYESKSIGVPVNFGRLYFSTITLDLIFSVISKPWLLVVVAIVAIFLALVGVGFPPAWISGGREFPTVQLVITLWLGFALVYAYPCRRIINSVRVLMTGNFDDTLDAEQLGARQPTREERVKIIDALKLIKARAGKKVFTGVEDWLVVDGPIPNSFTVGDTSYLTSAAIASQHLPALMAHELGHLENGDGVRLVALRRLVHPLMFFLGLDRQVTPIGVVAGGSMAPVDSRAPDEKIYQRVRSWETQLDLAGEYGGKGLLTYAPSWAAYWRQQDFEADECAAELGFAEELIALLQEYQVFDVAQPFLMSGRPYTAERIDRLKG